MERLPTTSSDAASVQSAEFPTNRWLPVSKFRLVAWLAGTLLLACVPVAVLLHWPRQMQAALEATIVQYVQYGTITDAERIAVYKNPKSAWMIHWATHPSMCLDVQGYRTGADVQIWSCNFSYPDQQRFILPPPNSPGEIRWAKHPELCLDHVGDVGLQLWNCSETPEKNRLFIVEHGGGLHNRIHWAAAPSACVVTPSLDAKNGNKLMLWDCEKNAGNAALQFRGWFH